MFNNSNIMIDRDKCLACGDCVNRCIMDNLRLSVAPCRQACPLGISCQTYLRLVAQDKAEEAAIRLRQHTPFAALLGQICHAPCEKKCERGQLGQKGCAQEGPVHIRAIKAHLAAQFPEIIHSPGQPAPASGKKIAIVGAGPAGLSAAYELAMDGHAVDIFEAEEKPGGMLRYAIPLHRLGNELIDSSFAQLEALGVALHTNHCLGKNLHLNKLLDDYEAVILAVGLEAAVRPPVTGSQDQNILTALDLLKSLNLSQAVPQLAGAKSAIVIGGGNTALDAALCLTKQGIGNVDLVCLESRAGMPAHVDEILAAEAAGVSIHNRWGIKEIIKSKTGFDLTLARCLDVFDSHKRFAPEMDWEHCIHMESDVLVFAIGQALGLSLDSSIKLQINQCGLLQGKADTGQVEGQTNLYVLGDCAQGAGSVVSAMGEGKKLARVVSRALQQKYPLVIDSWAESGMVREYESRPEHKQGGERSPSVQIDNPAWAKQEAERCMACGRSFEANKSCWFCLPCEIDCPVHALKVNIPYLVR